MAQDQQKMDKACSACTLKDRCVQTSEECFTRPQRWKALLLGFILPFIILAVGIIVMSMWDVDEMIIGGVVLVFVAVYYFVLWLCKPKI